MGEDLLTSLSIFLVESYLESWAIWANWVVEIMESR